MIVLLAYITDDITNNPDSNDTQQYKRPVSNTYLTFITYVKKINNLR